MTDPGITLHRLGLAAFGLLVVLLSFRAASSEDRSVRAGEIPTTEEFDSLHRYLTPVEAAPEPEDYLAFVPAMPSREVGPPAVSERVRPPAPPRRIPELSAILITSDTRIAIIDDEQASAGSDLPGGGRVIAIEPEYVVVESHGDRITLYPGGGENQRQ